MEKLKMHIVMVMMTGNATFAGGVPAVVQERARFLIGQGHQVSVICRAAVGFNEAHDRDGIHVYPVRAAGRMIEAFFARLQSVSPYFLLRLRRGLEAAHAAAPIDLIDLQDAPAILSVGPFCRRHGVPMVYTLHGSAMVNPGKRPWIGRKLHVAYEARAYAAARRVLGVSAWIAQTPARFGVTNIPVTVIPNTIDAKLLTLKRRADPMAAELRVLFLSRVFPEKHLDVLIRALADLPRGRFRVVVVGDGPERRAAEALADRLGVDDAIEWHGFVKDRERVFTLMETAHVFCFPTVYEAQGIALLETLAAGMYPVVSDIPVLREIVPAEYCFAPGNPVALAARLREIENDRPRLISLVNALRDLARPYQRTLIYPRLVDEYYAALTMETQS